MSQAGVQGRCSGRTCPALRLSRADGLGGLPGRFGQPSVLMIDPEIGGFVNLPRQRLSASSCAGQRRRLATGDVLPWRTVGSAGTICSPGPASRTRRGIAAATDRLGKFKGSSGGWAAAASPLPQAGSFAPPRRAVSKKSWEAARRGLRLAVALVGRGPTHDQVVRFRRAAAAVLANFGDLVPQILAVPDVGTEPAEYWRSPPRSRPIRRADRGRRLILRATSTMRQ